MGVELQKKVWDSQASPLKGPTMDLGLMETHSLWTQHQGSFWKGISGVWEGTSTWHQG